MATCRLVVNTALRKLGVLAAGREPRLADQTDALAALQGLYGAWVAAGAFGRLRDVVPITSPYRACGGEHVLRDSADIMEVELPDLVGRDWFWDYGWLRCCCYYNPNVPPRDGLVVRITDRIGGETRTWIYEGASKEWQRIEDLQLDDQAPRSTADMLGLSSCLAMEIADTYGDAGVITQVTAQQAARYKAAMTQRFGVERQPVPGVYC